MNRAPDSRPGGRDRRPPGAVGQGRFARAPRDGAASNDHGDDPAIGDLRAASDAECHFEIFRRDETRMTSTLFSGGDWRWSLVTTDGLILVEASGYPSEATCRAAVAVLQRQAATAPVIVAPGEHG